MTKYDTFKKVLAHPDVATGIKESVGDDVVALVSRDDTNLSQVLMLTSLYVAIGGPSSLATVVNSAVRLAPLVQAIIAKIEQEETPIALREEGAA